MACSVGCREKKGGGLPSPAGAACREGIDNPHRPSVGL